MLSGEYPGFQMVETWDAKYNIECNHIIVVSVGHINFAKTNDRKQFK